MLDTVAFAREHRRLSNLLDARRIYLEPASILGPRAAQRTAEDNLRYRAALKAQMARMLLDLMAEHLPWCPVRYAF